MNLKDFILAVDCLHKNLSRIVAEARKEYEHMKSYCHKTE